MGKSSALMPPAPPRSLQKSPERDIHFFSRILKKEIMKVPPPVPAGLPAAHSLRTKESELRRREMRLLRLEMEIKKEEQEWIEEQRKRNAELKQLDDQIEKEMAWKEAEWKKEKARRLTDLQNLEKSVASKRNELKSVTAQVARKLEMLKKKEDRLAEVEQQSELQEAEILHRQNELNDLSRRLESREAELVEKESIMMKRDQQVKDALIILKGKKEEVAQAASEAIQTMQVMERRRADASRIFEENKSFLHIAQQKLQKQLAAFAKTRQMLDREEQSVVGKIMVLQKTTLKMHQQEMSLRNVEQGIQQKQYKLDQEKGAFSRHVAAEEKRLGDARKQCREEREQLENMQLKVRAVRDFKVSLPELSQRYTEIMKRVQSEEKQLQRITAESAAKYAQHRDKERELAQREQDLRKQQALLQDLRMKLLRERQELSRTEFREFVGSELHRSEVREQIHEIKTLQGKPAVYEQFAAAQELLEMGRLNELRAKLPALQRAWEEARLPEQQKRKLAIDLMELQTEVKLAMLK
ncbi:hypothetical protein HY491_03150 [Candidatus Woesearchaeota archaeon]|nr:hypothetical protein [Candidatus Woesearchaeota archaeon]